MQIAKHEKYKIHKWVGPYHSMTHSVDKSRAKRVLCHTYGVQVEHETV